jgi:hypothetical protein
MRPSPAQMCAAACILLSLGCSESATGGNDGDASLADDGAIHDAAVDGGPSDAGAEAASHCPPSGSACSAEGEYIKCETDLIVALCGYGKYCTAYEQLENAPESLGCPTVPPVAGSACPGLRPYYCAYDCCGTALPVITAQCIDGMWCSVRPPSSNCVSEEGVGPQCGSTDAGAD